MKIQEISDNQNNLEEKKGGVLTPSTFKECYGAAIIEAVWCCHEGRLTDQWNRIESTEMNP